MVKAYGQDIPSEYYDLYKQILKREYKTGFIYFVNDYDYGYVGLIAKRSPWELPAWRGTDPDKIGRWRTLIRWTLKRIASVWSLQPVTTEVIPPQTGYRSKMWWVEQTPEAELSVYRYFTKQSFPYFSLQVKPPWGILPYIYISDSGNNRVVKRNVNDFSFTAKIGSYGPGINQFDNPGGLAIDGNNLFIADTGNKRIVILNKNTLAWLNTINNYSSPLVNFENPTDVTVDDKYIYIADTLKHKIIVLDKTTYNYVSDFYYQNLSIDNNPQPISLTCDRDTIYTCDNINNQIKIFIRNIRLKKQVFGYFSQDNYFFSDPHFIDIDLSYIYVADTGNNRIVQMLKFFPVPIATAGPGQTVEVDLAHPQGVAISGDYIVVTDTENNRLARFLKYPLTFDCFFGSIGSGDDQFATPCGVTAEPQHYFSEVGL